MSDELHFPQEEPQLNPHEQDPSASVISPWTGNSWSLPGWWRRWGFALGGRNTWGEHFIRRQLSASCIVIGNRSLDLPSSPEASTPWPQPLILNLQKDVPPSEYEKEYIPEIYVPVLIVPTMFLPIPNVRCSFSSNLLIWWLSRNLMYNICTTPILWLRSSTYIYPPEKRSARKETIFILSLLSWVF